MKFSVVAWHLPEREGLATGRALLATCEGLLAEGHEVDVWSWRDEPPTGDLPPWCRWQPLSEEPRWRTRGRSLARPRADIERIGWQPPDDAVVVADETESFAAVMASPRSVLTIHYATVYEVVAVRRLRAADIQWIRAERRVAKQARLVLAYSDRAGRASGVPHTVVPIASPDPGHAMEPVDEPVAGLIADWGWPPNRRALRLLLAAWAEVREVVPQARLLLAGRGIERMGIGTVPGVSVLGVLPAATDLLGSVAVLAFPCPSSSGPKMKVLEAMAYGIPVVTTAAGAEGIFADEGAGIVTADRSGFAAALARTLADPAGRAELGAAGREAFLATHAPRPAARLRVAACRAAFPGAG